MPLPIRLRPALATALLLAVLPPGVRSALAVRRAVPAALADRDGDGFPDAWERHGVWVEGPVGRRFIDLPAMGADPDRPDVFLQIDWMADARHDQHPSPGAIALVIDAFAAAPYVSPTGSVGIALHVDAGPDSILARPDRRWGTLSRARPLPWRDQIGTAASGSYDWRVFQSIKDRADGFTESGRTPVFHYAVFGYYHDRDDPRGSGASGIARGIGGTDILVTLGNFTGGVGTDFEQAASLMHELGHNLGLRHGGCDDENSKPGYVSIMSYTYQMTGITRGGLRGVLDFSRGAEPALDRTLAPGEPLPARVAGKVPPAACVAAGESRAGTSVSADPAPAGAPSGRGCPEGAAFNDWDHVRLRVGDIGRLPARQR